MIKEIKDFESCYKITTKGEVWSIKRKMFLKPSRGSYYTITLYDKDKIRSTSIHRLVAESFILNPKKKPYVNHIDGNKYNNNVENLEWVTASENDIHAVKMGLKKSSIKQKEWARKHVKVLHEKSSKKINQLNKEGKIIMVHKSIREASRTMGVSHQSIMGAIKRHGLCQGFKWEVA